MQVGIVGLLIALVLLPTPQIKADVVILQEGKIITGDVLQQDTDGVLIKMDYGTFRYPMSWVKDVRKNASASFAGSNSTQRIPDWAKIISTLATNEWAHELKQIPATVIDNGALQNVPYISFHCASDGYEINIYGDLDRPAGVEIGAINYLVKSTEAKSNCVEFISSVLSADGDKKAVRGLDVVHKDLEKKDGMTFETTFPDESDSYGGWWVSVYDESALTNARASGSELLAITQPRVAPKSQPAVEVPQPTIPTPETATTWAPDELSYARSTVSDYSGTGGRVYVRGYYRKDGTYVHSYTRSYPHSR